jgi:hypothetical protein
MHSQCSTRCHNVQIIHIMVQVKVKFHKIFFSEIKLTTMSWHLGRIFMDSSNVRHLVVLVMIIICTFHTTLLMLILIRHIISWQHVSTIFQSFLGQPLV